MWCYGCGKHFNGFVAHWGSSSSYGILGVYVKEKKWSVGAMCKILGIGGGLAQNSVMVNITSHTLVRH